MRIFWYASYVRTDEKTRAPKLPDHAQLWVYLGITSGIYKYYMTEVRHVKYSKYIVFDKERYPDTNVKTSDLPDSKADTLMWYGAVEDELHTWSLQINLSIRRYDVAYNSINPGTNEAKLEADDLGST